MLTFSACNYHHHNLQQQLLVLQSQMSRGRRGRRGMLRSNYYLCHLHYQVTILNFFLILNFNIRRRSSFYIWTFKTNNCKKKVGLNRIATVDQQQQASKTQNASAGIVLRQGQNFETENATDWKHGK